MGVNISPPERFHELLRFNFLPTLDIDSSWWQAEWLPDPASDVTRFPGCSQFYLSRFFLQRVDLANQFDFDFSVDEKQIALLPGKQLKRLVYLAGLTLQSRRIARVIRKNDRQAIKNAIGEEDYLFATRRGVRLLEEARFPSVPSVNEYDDFDALAESCQQAGIGSLATAMSRFSPALIRRLQFKLPRSGIENYWQAWDSSHDAHGRFLLKLEKEIRQA